MIILSSSYGSFLFDEKKLTSDLNAQMTMSIMGVFAQDMAEMLGLRAKCYIG